MSPPPDRQAARVAARWPDAACVIDALIGDPAPADFELAGLQKLLGTLPASRSWPR